MHTARPDLTVFDEIVRMEPCEVVGSLVAILGKKLTAYLASVKDSRTIDAWMQPGREEDDQIGRLRLALQVAKLLATRDSNRVVQAWFGAMNPQLGGRNPSRLLRDGNDYEAVLNAARAFLVGG